MRAVGDALRIGVMYDDGGVANQSLRLSLYIEWKTKNVLFG